MVQTLAALLSWIAMLAVIAIAFLVAGIWRPSAARSRVGLRQRAPNTISMLPPGPPGPSVRRR